MNIETEANGPGFVFASPQVARRYHTTDLAKSSTVSYRSGIPERRIF